MKWKDCKELISRDYFQLVGAAHVTKGRLCVGYLKKIFFNASFKVTFWFRIGSFLKSRRELYFKPLYWFVFLIFRHYQYKTGCQLYLGTEIGGGLMFPHFGCQVIHYAAVIGDNVIVYQGVTIGSMRGGNGCAPKIGNNVVLFPGAKIIGNITIGDNCVVGAGAVVTKDIPSGCVAAGVPAKVLSQKGEEITRLYIH